MSKWLSKNNDRFYDRCNNRYSMLEDESNHIEYKKGRNRLTMSLHAFIMHIPGGYIFPILTLFVFFSLSSCKSSRRASSSKSTDKISIAFDTGEETTTSSSKRTSRSAETSASTRYPAREYYGDNWNTEHVRYSSTKPSGTTTLNLQPGETGDFVMPVCGRVLSEFGPRGGRMHTGIDLKLEMNDRVCCAFDGMVRMAREYGAYGKMVVIRHDNGLETLYSHLNTIAVKENRRIKAGDRVGGGGRTGRATGVHLHFETRFRGEPFNPRIMVDFDKCKLKSNTLVLNENSYKQYYKNLQLPQPKVAAKPKPAKTTTAARSGKEKPEPQTAAADVDVPKLREHTVGKGDTLYNISRRYGMTVDSLRKLNRLPETAVIQIGQKLMVEATE